MDTKTPTQARPAASSSDSIPQQDDRPRFVRDILKRVPEFKFYTIFDVGANIGQSSEPLAKAFPDARIFAFEPVTSTFQTLSQNMGPYKNVQPINIALGAKNALVNFSADPDSTENKILLSEENGDSKDKSPIQSVEMLAGLNFCLNNNIGNISFMKIDAEGHDMEVLKGFSHFLDRVDFIQVEAGLNNHNNTHVPFLKFQALFDAMGFYLFHIYGEAFEFHKGGRPLSRRCNPIFINQRLVGDLSGIK